MLLTPARKLAQVRTTTQPSPRKPRTARPVALVPSPRRRPHPPSGQANHHHPNDFKRRLHPSPSAQPTHHPPRTPPHLSPIAQATILTVMPLQPAIHRRRNLPARGKTASPLPHTARKRSPTSTDHTHPRRHVEALTKPLPRFPLRQGAKIPPPPMATAAAAALSISASQAIKPIVPST